MSVIHLVIQSYGGVSIASVYQVYNLTEKAVRHRSFSRIFVFCVVLLPVLINLCHFNTARPQFYVM